VIRTLGQLEHAALAPEFDFGDPDVPQGAIDPAELHLEGLPADELVDRG
jgi:hypothetical protein